eukprot:3860838-Amphidinium_carterae.2
MCTKQSLPWTTFRIHVTPHVASSHGPHSLERLAQLPSRKTQAEQQQLTTSCTEAEVSTAAWACRNGTGALRQL